MHGRSRADLAIIIPVLNEKEGIGDCIQRLSALAENCSLELIVVDGDSAGSTVKFLSPGRAKTLIAGRGRARQMNAGAALASAEVLLFLHADSMLPPNAVQLVHDALKDGAVVGGAFALGIESEKAVFRVTERYVALRTRLTRIPFGDQAIFLRRDYFDAIGGYKDIPLMEEVELMKRVRKRGDRIAVLSEKVMTSARRWEREGILYCTIRNWTLQMLYALGVSPVRLAHWYRSY